MTSSVVRHSLALDKKKRNIASLDAPIAVDSDTYFHDLIPDASAVALDDGAESMLLKKKVQKMLNSGILTDREQGVLEMRYLRNEPLTLKEVGKEFNLPRERIRQIERDALRKLRNYNKL